MVVYPVLVSVCFVTPIEVSRGVDVKVKVVESHGPLLGYASKNGIEFR
jgi:hypothetical protein